MIQALGYSQTPFQPHRPGRLCRGRERWIEPWEGDDDEHELVRLVMSGATFSDDSAADARRGIPYSGLRLANVIAALFPRKKLFAWMEDGHPADIPEEAEGIEAYEGYRNGGRSELGLVRWYLHVQGVQSLRDLIGADLTAGERVRGFVVVDKDADDEELARRLFSLSGFSTLDSPPAHYQPLALASVLELGSAVILLHRDKHGPALGVYMREPMDGYEAKLAKLCDKVGTLAVPFAIPPMLARWDRALHELRSEWMREHDVDFPVPAAPEGQGWSPRGRRRKPRRGAEEE